MKHRFRRHEQARFAAFCAGMASSLALGSNLLNPTASFESLRGKRRPTSDAEAMSGDWAKVGNDLREALRKVKSVA